MCRDVPAEADLIASSGTLPTWLMTTVMSISTTVGEAVPPGDAAVAVGVGMLAAPVYIGVVQVGTAVSRSPTGALLVGLGFRAAERRPALCDRQCLCGIASRV
jgi:hypothetical protein